MSFLPASKKTEQDPCALKLVRCAAVFADCSAHPACPSNGGTSTRHDLGRSGMPNDRMELIDSQKIKVRNVACSQIAQSTLAISRIW